MEGYDARTYGARIAGIYDEMYGELFDDEAAVARLAGLAREGRALELAIGTGRIGLPLKQRGVDVAGIDISEAMVEKLREKPGGADVPIVMGDFATSVSTVTSTWCSWSSTRSLRSRRRTIR